MASFLDGILSPLGGGTPGAGGGGILSPLFADRQDSITAMGLGLLSGRNNAEGFEGAMQGFSQGRRSDLIRRGMEEEKAQKDREAMQVAQMAQKLGLPEATDPQVVRSLFVDRFKTREPRQLSFEERQFNMLPPEQQAEARKLMFAKTDGKLTYEQEVEGRRMAAERLGLRPDDPRYEQFVLSGRFPREDAQPLTATDKKAILEADEGVSAAESAIDALNKAKVLSPKAYGGFGASTLGTVTGTFGNEAGIATQELDNLVLGNALSQMKSIFGSNPTEGERSILLELQGASGKTDAVRQKIYDRAIEMAKRRLEFNKQRAAALRGGSFYGAGGRQAPQGGGATPQSGGPVVIDGYTIKAR